MYYDKKEKLFHIYPNDRDVEDVVAKLKRFTDGIEKGYHGALSLNDFGDIFGNEFWNLVYPVELRIVVDQGRR
jgi:hypothetical protein